jgi:hypothetical protein
MIKASLTQHTTNTIYTTLRDATLRSKQRDRAMSRVALSPAG